MSQQRKRIVGAHGKHVRITLQFPMSWFNTASLPKQWLDDVLSHAWAFGPGGDKLEGMEIGVAGSIADRRMRIRPARSII